MPNASDVIDDLIQARMRRATEAERDWRIPQTYQGAVLAATRCADLIDRLVIVNLKLYHLKNAQARVPIAEQARQDVVLVQERALLKRAIEEKLGAMAGAQMPPEVKQYG